jgi:hypothetical protein
MQTQSDAPKRRGAKPQPIKHGTLHAYRKYKCRCRPCIDAQTERCNTWTRTRDLANAPHGTVSGYINWRCRCYACKLAGSIQNKEVKARMIARGWIPKARRK